MFCLSVVNTTYTVHVPHAIPAKDSTFRGMQQGPLASSSAVRIAGMRAELNGLAIRVDDTKLAPTLRKTLEMRAKNFTEALEEWNEDQTGLDASIVALLWRNVENAYTKYLERLFKANGIEVIPPATSLLV